MPEYDQCARRGAAEVPLRIVEDAARNAFAKPLTMAMPRSFQEKIETERARTNGRMRISISS